MTSHSAQETSPDFSPADGLTPEDPGYRRAMVGALCAGLASYNALYATQAVLPNLTESFGINPTLAALTVSATTGALAIAVIPTSIISERFGRRQVIQISVLAATLISLLLAFLPSIGSLVAVRAVQGLAIAGVPAVAMAYLSEEISSKHLSKVMGFYIAGNTLGGLIGRLIPGTALEFFEWRGAVFTGAIFAFLTAILTAVVLPAQRNFHPKKITFSHELSALGRHLRNHSLLKLFLLPFLMMGAFVSLYNFLGFRLISDFGLPASLAAFVFIMYLSGTWSSARAGTYIEKFGRGAVLTWSLLIAIAGLALLLAPWLWATLAGTLLFTASFFAAHSTASSWVGLAATSDRAEASSIYILSYYLGSSVIGWVSGFFFHHGWPALIAWLCALFAIAFAVSLTLNGPGSVRAKLRPQKRD